jgi:HTH-type transcriptional regulator/antitoxin HipB
MADLARTPRPIGTIIQRTRKKRGWTQRDLAARAGLRQATISTIETAETPAKLDTILAVLAALDLEFQIAPRSLGDNTDIEDLF